jgi:sugar lactone lactonase YvrE
MTAKTSRRKLSWIAGGAVALAAACDPQPEAEQSCKESGTICTYAGIGERSFNGDGRPRLESSFYWPLDLDFAPDGRAYVLDWQNHRVRRINADDRLETVIGSDFVGDGPRPGQVSDTSPEGAPGTTCELNHPTDLVFLPDGSMLLAAWHNHKIRRFDPATGLVNVICGAGPGMAGDDMPAARATLNQPKSLVADSAGNVYIADSRNQRIRLIEKESGKIIRVAGTGMQGFAGDDGPPEQASFRLQEVNENPEPGGSIALDGQGRLYLADTLNDRVRRIDFAARTVTTVAGNGERAFSGDGGPATAASLNRPRDVEIGPDNRLYIADTDNHRVRAVDLGTGVIVTVAGNGQATYAGDGGPASAASLHRPFGISFDRTGALYVADTFNDRIRRVTP